MRTLNVLLIDFDPSKKEYFLAGLNDSAFDDNYHLIIVSATPYYYKETNLEKETFDLILISGITAQNNTNMIEKLKKQGSVIGISCLSDFKSRLEDLGIKNFINISSTSYLEAWEQIKIIIEKTIEAQ